MSENRLEELKVSSKPALDHIELVELARTQSPSQAGKLARTAKWPKRQADACRSLAILRRDHGNEVFTDFIATMGRVRAGDTVTEQVQDNRRKTVNSNIEKNLERVTDPIAKLRLAVKHDLKPQVIAIINELLNQRNVFFWCNIQDENTLFDTLSHLEKPENMSAINTDQARENERQYRYRVGIVFAKTDTEKQLTCDVLGMKEFCGFSDEDFKTMLRSILTKLIDQTPHAPHWEYLLAMTTVIRTFFLPEDDFTEEVEIWLLRCHLQTGRLFELRSTALPTPIEDNSSVERNELNPIVSRFIELGWAKEQVREEFLGLIKKFAHNCRPQFMVALAGAKCFSYDDYPLDTLLFEEYIPSLWENVVSDEGDFYIKYLYKLGDVGNSTNELGKRAKEFYRTKLVELLAQGQVTKAYQIILSVADRFRLLIVPGVPFNRSIKESEYFHSLIPQAFKTTYDAENYGVAAAFVQHFGKKACYSEAWLESLSKELAAPELEAVGANYHEAEKLWDSGEADDDYIESGIGKEWQDALSAVETKRTTMLGELKSELNKQIDDVTQLAVDLDHPIRFNGVLTYYVVPEWQKH